MRCTYTSKLLFQRSLMLRNYAFWGFSDSIVDGFEQVAATVNDSHAISPKVAIGHVDVLAGVEDQPLGLFATDAIAALEFLGEYAGVVKVHADGANQFDPYGISYPSVYEGGDLYVSAAEYGNVIRCINHSGRPNARFVPMVHGGILRIFCVRLSRVCIGDVTCCQGLTYDARAGSLRLHRSPRANRSSSTTAPRTGRPRPSRRSTFRRGAQATCCILCLLMDEYTRRRVAHSAETLVLDLDDGLDLDRHVERQRVGADGRARVHALVAEHLAERVGRAVHDARLAREPVHAVDEAHELDHALDLVQVAQLVCSPRSNTVSVSSPLHATT